ncbi:MAG TPA: sialate O-acetylesterase [Paludibacter sp.]|nr:sialate O-acetylesterase [Paludibacter sp.]
MILVSLISPANVATSKAQKDFAGSTLRTSLQAILVNGDTIENFDPRKNTYAINLPFTTLNSPKIGVILKNPDVVVKIFPAPNLFGNIKERTAIVLISPLDKSYTLSYNLTFSVLPKLDLYLFAGHTGIYSNAIISPYYPEELPRVYLFTSKYGMEPATNPYYRYSNLYPELVMQPIEMEYVFSKRITGNTSARIGLIVNTTNQPEGLFSYDRTLFRTISALKWGTLKAIIWRTPKDMASISMKDLALLVKNLRNDLGYPNVLFIAGEITKPTIFQQVILSFDHNIPNSIWISDLSNTSEANREPYRDANNQLVFGDRLADLVLKYCY